MPKKNILELSISEAKNLILDQQLKMIKDMSENDPKSMREILVEGLEKFFKPIGKMTEKEVCDLIGELNWGQDLADKEGVDLVMIRINSTSADVVFDRHDPNCNGDEFFEEFTIGS